MLARKEATTAIVIAAGGYFFYLGTEIKHYCFEAAATACVIYAVARLVRTPSQRAEQIFLLGAAFFGAIFSFTILVTIIACSIGLAGTFLWKIYFQTSKTRHNNFPAVLRVYFTSYWQSLAYCGAATLIALIFYEAYDSIITRYNFVAYADVYVSSDAKSAILLLSSMMIELLLPWRPDFAGTYSAAGLTLTIMFLFVLASIIALIRRRFQFIALTSVAALTLVCAGKIIGVFPYVWARHLYFLAPLLAIACSLAGWELVTLIKSRLHGRARMIPAAVFVLFLALYPAGALKRSLSPVHEAITPLLAEIENGPKNIPVWVYVYAQPAFELQADPDTPTLGMSENRTSALGWEKAVKKRSGGVIGDTYLRNSARKLREIPRVWLFFSHDKVGDTQSMKKLIEREGHSCSLRTIIYGSSLYFCSRTNISNDFVSRRNADQVFRPGIDGLDSG